VSRSRVLGKGLVVAGSGGGDPRFLGRWITYVVVGETLGFLAVAVVTGIGLRRMLRRASSPSADGPAGTGSLGTAPTGA
jgi:hypothetical protein